MIRIEIKLHANSKVHCSCIGLGFLFVLSQIFFNKFVFWIKIYNSCIYANSQVTFKEWEKVALKIELNG